MNCYGAPSGIDINKSGDIYVTCWHDNSIHVFDHAGQQKRSVGIYRGGNGQFSSP